MALFSRKKKNDALVTQIVAELQKASNNMGNTPYGGSGYATTSAAMPSQMTPSPGSGGQGLLQTPGMQANPLPRPAMDFGSQLGPSAPFLPAPLDPVFDDSGRALPRLWEYPVAWNLDLNQRTAPWTVLRSMADQIDIIHRCIEIKIAEITRLEWSFNVEDATINAIMAEENCSHAKAARIAREKYDEDIIRLREFWENPYPQMGRSFTEWMTEFLWQHFVFDGTPVYPRYNLGKDVIGFEIIDAPTIKVLLDNRGSNPAPPAPSFQQILWGFPRGEYQTSPDSDGEFFNAPGKNNEYLRDQLAYFVRNRRTWSPYGYSCVEEAVPSATLYLERQQWMKSEYQDGTMPMAFFETDSDEMDITRLAAFERVFNDRIAGSNAERHRMKVLPRGFKPIFAPTVDERYKDSYDNFLILRIATIFGVAPSALGIIPRSGLGGAGEREGEAQHALTTSQKPLESFLIETINTLSRRFLGSDKNITFAFDDNTDNVQAMETKAKAYQTSLASGQMTINDVRGELGMPLFDNQESDEPFIVAGNSIQFLKGLLAVDSSGETIGQKENTNGQMDTGSGSGNTNEVTQSAQSKDKKTEGVQSSDTQVKAQETELKNAEAKAFKKFQEKPRSREFVFKHHSEDEVEVLKAQITDNTKGVPLLTKVTAADLPGYSIKIKIEKHYAPQIARAFVNAVKGVDEAIEEAIRTNKAPSPDFKLKLKFDKTPLEKPLRGVYMDAGYAGTAHAIREIPGFKPKDLLGQAAIKNDWSTWKPGNPLASDMVSGGALRKTLDRTGITLDGIGKSMLDRIGNAIGIGVSQGLPSTQIGDLVNSLINDPLRADLIAQTETSRAFNEASLTQFADAGVTMYQWLAYDGACPDCEEIAMGGGGDGVYALDEIDPPPLHPNCRCAILAVISTS